MVALIKSKVGFPHLFLCVMSVFAYLLFAPNTVSEPINSPQAPNTLVVAHHVLQDMGFTEVGMVLDGIEYTLPTRPDGTNEEINLFEMSIKEVAVMQFMYPDQYQEFIRVNVKELQIQEYIYANGFSVSLEVYQLAEQCRLDTWKEENPLYGGFILYPVPLVLVANSQNAELLPTYIKCHFS